MSGIRHTSVMSMVNIKETGTLRAGFVGGGLTAEVRSRAARIHICRPNGTHAPFATLALNAGQRVFFDKSSAASVANAEALIAPENRSGLVAAGRNSLFAIHKRITNQPLGFRYFGSATCWDISTHSTALLPGRTRP